MAKTDPREYYKEEAFELLTTLEQNLLDLEESPRDMDIVNNIFRALHTIKGSGSMFGFDHIARFTHEVETLFDLIREGKITSDSALIDCTLAARDHIKVLLINDDELPEEKDEETEKELLSIIQRWIGKTESEKETPSSATPAGTSAEETHGEQEVRTYRIIFKPEKALFLRGVNPLLLVQEICELGECLVMAHLSGIPSLEDLDPETCYAEWTIIVTTSRNENTIRDVFIFVEDSSEIKIDVIDEGTLDAEVDYKLIGEILYEQGFIDKTTIQNILTEKPPFGEIALEQGIVSEEEIQSALEEQKYVRQLRKKRQDTTTSSTIRVRNEKLDQLVDLVGELVTLQARLSQYAEESTDSDIENVSESLERLTAELRDSAMEIRMVPLAETFRNLYRLVRDISSDLGKEAELVTIGAETELDKTVIDQLKDPLVHIIRNAVDHGLEMPEERESRGKNRKGTVTLEAINSGANVLLSIKDDGKGLDSEKIRNKAIEKNIISPEQVLTESEIYELVFAPGFSTSEVTTNLSGRGVGMDVVKKNIEKLRGSIDIHSKQGKGTTIVLTIPLTLSIIDGLLISVGQDKYTINLGLVDECFEFTSEMKESAKGSGVVQIRDALVPYVRLRDIFDYTDAYDREEQIAIVNVENTKLGIVIDSILGQFQTVIKPLSNALKHVEEISGSTILGDGSIALILDANKIAKNVELSRKKTKGGAYNG